MPEVLITSACDPPCWHSITPGVTTKTEVLSVLPELPFINKDSLYHGRATTEAEFHRDAGALNVAIFYDEYDVVKVILVDPRYRFSLENITAYYGEPEKVLAVQGYTVNEGYTVHLIYSSRGIATVSARRPFDPEKRRADIKESYQVLGIFFFNPLLLDQVFSDLTISNFPEETIRAGLQDWQGFGEIELVFLR